MRFTSYQRERKCIEKSMSTFDSECEGKQCQTGRACSTLLRMHFVRRRSSTVVEREQDIVFYVPVAAPSTFCDKKRTARPRSTLLLRTAL